MRTFVSLLITLALAATIDGGQRSENSRESELTALVKSFNAAIVNNDPSAIEQFIAPEWIIVDPDGGVMDRARFLEVIRSGALTHQSMDSEDMRIRFYGDTAVMTALTSTKGTFMDQAFTTTERATDVFVKRDRRWQCVITHLTRFTKKKMQGA